MNLVEKKKAGKSEIRIDDLKRMAQMDIRKVNREELVNLEDVELDASLSDEDRVRSYLAQIKNPYCYISNGVIVKISFAGKCRLEDCLAKCMGME